MTQVVRLTKKVAELNDLVSQAIPDLDNRVMDLEIRQEPRPHGPESPLSFDSYHPTSHNMDALLP